MPTLAELRKARLDQYRTELVALDAAILQVEQDNAQRASLEEYTIDRVRLETLRKQRTYVNTRMVELQSQIYGKSYIWGRTVKVELPNA